MNYRRYAVYFTPSDPALAGFGARWLGWDVAAGNAVEQPEPAGLPAPLAEITQTPRRYGFHATIKPPFRLAGGQDVEALNDALAALCDQMPPVTLVGLVLSRLGRFLALLPTGDTAQLNGLAAMVVETLDTFRAPASEDELQRRRATGLTPAQEALLTRWGYPYVMHEFRFHMTLTGKLPKAQIAPVQAVLADALADILPAPFVIDGLSLVGEDADGRFHLLHRHILSA